MPKDSCVKINLPMLKEVVEKRGITTERLATSTNVGLSRVIEILETGLISATILYKFIDFLRVEEVELLATKENPDVHKNKQYQNILKTEKRRAIFVAEQLTYGPHIINKIKSATTIGEIERALRQGRSELPDR